MIEDLKTVNKLFIKHKIPLWLDWGTLLGVYRDGKFIDNDLDLSTIKFNSPYGKVKFDCLIYDLQNEGFNVEQNVLDLVLTKGDFRAGIAYYEIDNEAVALYQRGLSVNYEEKFFAKKWFYLFIRDKPTNLKYFFFKLFGGVMVITTVPVDMVCPLRKFKFEGVYFNIPNNTEEYLEYLYGKDWKIPDSHWPGHANKKNIGCFKGTHTKFYIKCPRCKKVSLSERPDFVKPIETIKLNCTQCNKTWKEKVAVRGTVLRKL